MCVDNTYMDFHKSWVEDDNVTTSFDIAVLFNIYL